jgi:hypothetical protein
MCNCSIVVFQPISNIYVLKYFQWYKDFFNPMNFLPLQSPSKNSGLHWDSNFQSGSSFGSVGVHSVTFSYTLGSMKCDFQASLFAHTFASPCLGHKPKVKVATMWIMQFFSNNQNPLHNPQHMGWQKINEVRKINNAIESKKHMHEMKKTS